MSLLLWGFVADDDGCQYSNSTPCIDEIIISYHLISSYSARWLVTRTQKLIGVYFSVSEDSRFDEDHHISQSTHPEFLVYVMSI